MNFPKRIKQHKAQSDSFAILLYHLRDVGIFRNATENDYGIDFEIEMLQGEQVIGKYIKVQVKSSEDIYVREDGVPTIGGIKQSTLLYWAELSFSTHVLVFAVDITTEKIYITQPIFWQAIALIDKTETTKTLNFLKDTAYDAASGRTPKEHEEIMLKIKTPIIQAFAHSASIADVINAHKSILRNLKDVFELYTDTWHYDYHMEVQKISTLKLLFDAGHFLVYLPSNIEGLTEEERQNLFNFEYWESITDWSDDDVQNYVAQKPLKVILPLLLDGLEKYNERVMKAQYYWKRKDWPYLKLVQSINLPKERDHDSLIDLDYDQFNFYSNRDPNFYYTID